MGDEREGRSPPPPGARRWFPVCPSSDLGRQPVGVIIGDLPLVVFRDDHGVPHALLDRCPHRDVPLSLGRVTDGCLECSNHGWRFDGSGRQVTVPGFAEEPDIVTTADPTRDPADPRDAAIAALEAALAAAPRRSVPAYPSSEHDGFVWVSET